MKKIQIDPYVREAIAIWEALRRLGFSVDRIGVGQSKGNAFVSLSHQGRFFNVFLGPLVTLSFDSFKGRWAEACKAIATDSVNPAETQAILEGSNVYSRMEDLIEQLIERKFLTPNTVLAAFEMKANLRERLGDELVVLDIPKKKDDSDDSGPN